MYVVFLQNLLHLMVLAYVSEPSVQLREYDLVDLVGLDIV